MAKKQYYVIIFQGLNFEKTKSVHFKWNDSAAKYFNLYQHCISLF